MTTNTDPVRALIGEMTEYLDQQVDPELDVIEQWRDRLESALAQQPAIGEEIMVNAAHGVFTLPLQPSGLNGPRFVVHVPAPEQQPAAPSGSMVDEAMVDRAGQELYGADWGSFEGWEAYQLRSKVRAVLTAALAAQQQGGAA